MTTIGFIESTSISRGILISDYMVKAANIDIVFSKPVCPGKHIVLISGDVADVNTAINVGVEYGANFVVDSLVIPNIHPQVIPAINDVTPVNRVGALGVVEYFSITGAIIGADAAAKAADIGLLEARLGVGIGGKSFLTLNGSVSSVESAVSAATKDALEKGLLVDFCIIPSPDESLYFQLV